MANTVIIGAQWGDEGKGKIVDMLSAQSGLIVRFQGGNNAGHTIKVQGRETILHLIPSGILHEGKNCLIGNGVVLDPFVFLKEVDELAAKGIDVSPSRLGISKKTHLIMPYHKSLDNAREAKRAGKKIGTQRGTTGYLYCSDDFGEDAVVAYDNGLTAVQALNNGQVDAVVIDNEPAKAYVESNPGLKILDTSYAEEDYAIGMNKSNTALLEAVNAALEELKADGTLQAIVDKYIKAE